MKYSVHWLLDKLSRGEPVKYIFFWGHTPRPNEEIGKFIFSQWYESPFTVDEIIYPTSEHWMMAKKALLFKDEETFRKILAAEKPPEAKSLGRQVANYDDALWNERKYEIVRQGNIHKFGQNPALKKYLLGTEDRVIVEASPVDAIWGIGMAQDHKNINNPELWRGENLLGFAIMEARDYLKTDNFSEFISTYVSNM